MNKMTWSIKKTNGNYALMRDGDELGYMVVHQTAAVICSLLNAVERVGTGKVAPPDVEDEPIRPVIKMEDEPGEFIYENLSMDGIMDRLIEHERTTSQKTQTILQDLDRLAVQINEIREKQDDLEQLIEVDDEKTENSFAVICDDIKKHKTQISNLQAWRDENENELSKHENGFRQWIGHIERLEKLINDVLADSIKKRGVLSARLDKLETWRTDLDDNMGEWAEKSVEALESRDCEIDKRLDALENHQCGDPVSGKIPSSCGDLTELAGRVVKLEHQDQTTIDANRHILHECDRKIEDAFRMIRDLHDLRHADLMNGRGCKCSSDTPNHGATGRHRDECYLCHGDGQITVVNNKPGEPGKIVILCPNCKSDDEVTDRHRDGEFAGIKKHDCETCKDTGRFIQWAPGGKGSAGTVRRQTSCPDCTPKKKPCPHYNSLGKCPSDCVGIETKYCTYWNKDKGSGLPDCKPDPVARETEIKCKRCRDQGWRYVSTKDPDGEIKTERESCPDCGTVEKVAESGPVCEEVPNCELCGNPGYVQDFFQNPNGGWLCKDCYDAKP
jgi:hypothetical protein